jgi:DegV family protein with EDD domain
MKMAKIALLTDSTTYVPKELSNQYEIHVVPSVVIWGEEVVRDGVDIQPADFYKRLAASKVSPTTSQPTPAFFMDKLKELSAKGFTDFLGIFVSRKLSGTIGSAEQAQQQLPDLNFRIVDAQSASMGTGWALLEAAKAAKAGKSLEECVKVAEEASKHTGVLILVDTLEYLHRGGRIGGAQRFLGTALNLKPLLELVDGRLEPIERVRTKGKAVERLVEILVERVAGRKPVRLGVLHANAPDEAKALLAEGIKAVSPVETTLSDVSPAVGTHTGPGTIGFAYMAGYEQ